MSMQTTEQVTFSLNIENLEADDIVVPSRTELYEDTEEEALPLDDIEAPKAEADQGTEAEADGTEIQTDTEEQSGWSDPVIGDRHKKQKKTD